MCFKFIFLAPLFLILTPLFLKVAKWQSGKVAKWQSGVKKSMFFLKKPS
jgi:hypothetical protein